MTTLYKHTEGKPFVYRSDKPFPRKEEYVNPESAEWLQEKYRRYYKADCDLWFTSVERIPVKEGEEEKFDDYIVLNAKNIVFEQGFEKSLSEGVEIDPSCYVIENDYGVEKQLAVFVPPMVDHANEKTTGWISVKDRLPEPGYDKYIVAGLWDPIIGDTKTQFVSAAYLQENQDAMGNKILQWHWDIDDAPADGITHWMPLPEPPHEKH